MLQLVKREGTGTELPMTGDQVFVHYEGRLLDGTVFDHSRFRNDWFSFVLGKGLSGPTPNPSFDVRSLPVAPTFSLFVHRSSHQGVGLRGGHHEGWRIVSARLQARVCVWICRQPAQDPPERHPCF